jgi:phosphatidylserine/phosphatidylglycerophosphate/cardiolipin synthase-like enzyme
MSTRRRPINWQGIAILIVVLLCVALYDAYMAQSDTGESPTVVPQPATDTVPVSPQPEASEAFQIYMNTGELIYPDVPQNRTQPALYTAFLADITAATASIDIAVFDIDLPELGDALVAAAKRGVVVRVAYDDENLTDARVAKLIGALQDANITVRSDQREPFLHQKTAVIDARIVWTGSWNMTMNDTYRNNNNMVRMVSPQMAKGYTTEADQLIAGLFGVHKTSNAPHPLITIGARTIRYAFSPVDGINAQVVALLDGAKTDITFMAFSYTDPAISSAMVRAQKRGVQVRGIVEKQNVRGTGSVFEKLKKAKVDISADGNCYIMHHKTIVIDDQTVITGSYNFTKSAEKSNDENLIVITDPTAVQIYLDEYTLVRERADDPTACKS